MKKKLERLCVRFADCVILNTERLRQNFVATYPKKWEHKFIAIPNGVDDCIVKPVEEYLALSQPRKDNTPLTLCHPGSIYWHRSLMPIIEAMRQLKQSGDQVYFEQIGLVTHPPDLAEQLLDWDLPEVRLLGRLSHEATLQQMANSDVLVVIQPMSTLQVPAKLYEMLIFRKPILVITKDGATADLIKEYEIGFIADPTDPEKIAHAIRALDSQMKSELIRGDWDRAIHAFDSQNLTSQLVNVMTKITK
jgi:glycosyltransferase involved in cell wall biosynthesis